MEYIEKRWGSYEDLRDMLDDKEFDRLEENMANYLGIDYEALLEERR